MDGNGLMLVVRPTGKKSWLLRYQMNGVRRDMGLGSYPEIGPQSPPADRRRPSHDRGGEGPHRRPTSSPNGRHAVPTFGGDPPPSLSPTRRRKRPITR